MGLFNKLTKKSIKLIDLHTNVTRDLTLVKFHATLLQMLHFEFSELQWSKLESQPIEDRADDALDFLELPKLCMSEDEEGLAKATYKSSEFWNSYLGMHLDCLIIAQNECTLEENFHPAIKDAIRNLHQMFLHDIIVLYESSNEVEELSEDYFKNSLEPGLDLIDFFREEGRNHPGLLHVSSYYLENGWELDWVKQFQECEDTIKKLTEHHVKLCNLYSGYFNDVIITDWEEYLK